MSIFHDNTGRRSLMSPRRPADLGDSVTLAGIVRVYSEHSGRLIDARLGIGDPKSADELAEHALAALAAQHALAERALCSRWVTTVDALVHGATMDQVATAMALTAKEVTAGLQSWADGQHRAGYITAAVHDEVLTLLEKAGR